MKRRSPRRAMAAAVVVGVVGTTGALTASAATASVRQAPTDHDTGSAIEGANGPVEEALVDGPSEDGESEDAEDTSGDGLQEATGPAEGALAEEGPEDGESEDSEETSGDGLNEATGSVEQALTDDSPEAGEEYSSGAFDDATGPAQDAMTGKSSDAEVSRDGSAVPARSGRAADAVRGDAAPAGAAPDAGRPSPAGHYAGDHSGEHPARYDHYDESWQVDRRRDHGHGERYDDHHHGVGPAAASLRRGYEDLGGSGHGFMANYGPTGPGGSAPRPFLARPNGMYGPPHGYAHPGVSPGSYAGFRAPDVRSVGAMPLGMRTVAFSPAGATDPSTALAGPAGDDGGPLAELLIVVFLGSLAGVVGGHVVLRRGGRTAFRI